MILVYEYMSAGTLEDHLHKLVKADDNFTPLSWVQRLKICIGAARGLDYLHTGTSIQQRVLHRDVKPSNILLDENYEAKISDFGLSRIGPANQICSTNVYTDQIKGTFGNMDPEYFLIHRLTRKSDVYAFGVVLFEVLCGRPAVDGSLESEQIGLAGLAQHSVQEGNLDYIIDSSLRDQILPDCLSTFAEIANECLLRDPKKRPTMAEIVVRLESVLTLQVQKGPSQESLGGKKCYMLAARKLNIAWGDTPKHWKWTSLPDARFKEVAEVLYVYWLEIHGSISTCLLSPDTNYAAYLVYKLTDNATGFDWNYAYAKVLPEVSVGRIGEESEVRFAVLKPEGRDVSIEQEYCGTESSGQAREADVIYPKERKDGWLEVELGEYFNKGEEDVDLKLSLKEVKALNYKRGLIVQGIEIRPKEVKRGFLF